MKYLHWRGIAELSFARAAASYAYFDPKRRLIRFDPYSTYSRRPGRRQMVAKTTLLPSKVVFPQS
jgi:hypothetical protein